MRIRFLSEQIYETGGPGKGPRFPQGFVLDEADVAEALGLKTPPAEGWAVGFLGRWVQRQVAEEVGDDVKQSSIDDMGQGLGKRAAGNTPLGTAKRRRATKGNGDTEQVEKTNLKALTRPELDALAAKRKVDVSEAKNKDDVIAALELAEELGGHD